MMSTTILKARNLFNLDNVKKFIKKDNTVIDSFHYCIDYIIN